MTRRILLYRDEQGILWHTPEFNGDRREFQAFGSRDSCDADWPETLKLFEGTASLQDLHKASRAASKLYHSQFGKEHALPVEVLGARDSLNQDEVYLIADGIPTLLRENEITEMRENLL